MKSSFKLLPLLAVLGGVGWVGCKTETPTSYLSSSGPNPAMIVNFEGATPLNVNPNLAEAGEPGSVVQKPGIIAATGSPLVTPQVVTSGADNTAHCVWMNSPVSDPGNGSYPAVELVVPLETAGSGIYNASLFSGIEFYLKVMGDDTAGTRSFSVPVVQTSVPPQGTCNPSASSNACYNNFEYVYSSTGGVWQLVSLPFSAFTRQNYGSAISPSTLSGANLQQIISLQWSEGNNNVKGNVNVDFYVDEVQFF